MNLLNGGMPTCLNGGLCSDGHVRASFNVIHTVAVGVRMRRTWFDAYIDIICSC